MILGKRDHDEQGFVDSVPFDSATSRITRSWTFSVDVTLVKHEVGYSISFEWPDHSPLEAQAIVDAALESLDEETSR